MKHSIHAQIEEVEYELAMRERVYPGLIRKGRLRHREGAMHVERLEGVLATLRWVRDNAEELRRQATEAA